MSKVMFLVNHDITIYNFRLELVERLIAEGHSVIILSPFGERVESMIDMGCEYYEIKLSRHGKNPFQELSLIYEYKKLLEKIKPDIVLTYTIKPNIYGSLVCGGLGINCVVNITGLGIALENPGVLKKILILLYKFSLRKTQKVFFQNAENEKFMLSHGVIKTPYELLPGSGVNLEQHCYEKYPEESDELILLVIGRLMKDKGTDEILFAAEKIKKEYPKVVFRLLGYCDETYKEKIDTAISKGIVEYVGLQTDVHSFIKNSHATVHASYHEGMANVLLETAAGGRPIVATDVPGCRETFDSESGISCKARDGEDLFRAIKEFIELPYEKKKAMGVAGRKKMEKEFNRTIIVDKYMKEINKVDEREIATVV